MRGVKHMGWGKEPGNDVVREEVLTFVPPPSQPAEIRKALTQIVPKPRSFPTRRSRKLQVISTRGGSLQPRRSFKHFSKDSGIYPEQTRANYFAVKKKLSSNCWCSILNPWQLMSTLLVWRTTNLKKARICLQGQSHEGFQVQNSTTNADAHLLLRLFLAMRARPNLV